MNTWNSSLTTLVGGFVEPIFDGEQNLKKIYAVYCNSNNRVYGIPLFGRYIYKFNPDDKSCTTIDIQQIEHDLKLVEGVEDGKGCIYCTAIWKERVRRVRTIYGLVKIDTTRDDAVTLLGPHHFHILCTTRGVLGLDGNIYYIPKRRSGKMLKLNTDSDTFEHVGQIVENGYSWACLGKDGCIYGIPHKINTIVKYDPVTIVTSLVGEKYTFPFDCECNGALAKNGCIYAFSSYNNWILKIDTNEHGENDTFVAWELITNFSIHEGSPYHSYGEAIMGLDGCIYWPPLDANLTLKHDPLNGHTSCVGNNFGTLSLKYYGGALAQDGVIYCIPWHAAMVLAIDPFRVFQETVAYYMERYPERFGCGLFDNNEKGITFFDSAINTYGRRGFEAVIHLLPKPDVLELPNRELYPYVEAALCPNSALSVVYYLLRQAPDMLRQAPDLIPTTIIACGDTVEPLSDDDNPLSKKKKKIHCNVYTISI